MAEHGFFVKEMNVGWAEWTEANLPTHEGRVARGEIRCDCSFGAQAPVASPQEKSAGGS